jgi:hypothetical protein
LQSLPGDDVADATGEESDELFAIAGESDLFPFGNSFGLS